MQQTFNFYQVILLILSILTLNYAMLWGFHYFEIKPYPNNEIYILGLSYLVILLLTAFIATNKNLKHIHSVLGLKKTCIKAISFALFIGAILWLVDYIYQVHYLQNDLSHEAKQWFLTHSKQVITFITMVIIAPVIEEITLRGILLPSLNRYINKYIAVFIVSLSFTLLHDSYAQWPTLFIASTLYCWLTLHYKSILPAIFAHILNNALTFVLYRLLIL